MHRSPLRNAAITIGKQTAALRALPSTAPLSYKFFTFSPKPLQSPAFYCIINAARIFRIVLIITALFVLFALLDFFGIWSFTRII